MNDLQTDYVDLLLIHEPYDESRLMYRAMKEARDAGKIKAVGISNFNGRRYSDFVKSCGLIPAVNQVECHVFYRQRELQRILEAKGTHMQAWSPFACGKNDFFRNAVLTEIGKKYGKSVGQTGLKYLIQTGVSAVPKSLSAERMKENIDIFDFDLDEEDLSKISAPDENRTLFGWY